MILEKSSANCTAVYEEFDGNFGDISNCKTREELPC